MPDAPGALPLSCGKAHCGAIGLCKARGVMRDGALASLFNRPLRETTRRTGPRQTSVHYKLRTVAHNLPRPLPLGHVIVKKPQGWTVYLAPVPLPCGSTHLGANGLCNARGVMGGGRSRFTLQSTNERDRTLTRLLQVSSHTNLSRPLLLGHVIVRQPQGWTVYLAPPPSADALAHRRLPRPHSASKAAPCPHYMGASAGKG